MDLKLFHRVASLLTSAKCESAILFLAQSVSLAYHGWFPDDMGQITFILPPHADPDDDPAPAPRLTPHRPPPDRGAAGGGGSSFLEMMGNQSGPDLRGGVVLSVDSQTPDREAGRKRPAADISPS